NSFTSTPATAIVTVHQPQLDLGKTVLPATASPGNTLTYTFTPVYTDTTLLQNGQIVDAIPTNTTYVANSANADGVFDGVGNTVTWSIGSNTADVPGVTSPIGTALCPGSVTLTATADTYIDKNSANSNFGASNLMNTRPSDANHVKHSLVQ